ncbi:hypothetical protein HZU75_03280 [Chitinibacter fontanus]|uniref:DUF1090 family protein n=1 Tax=Chitinibacter fontanus TaxID=1737446 RepID=A0A7D5ZHE7_9NEIS|nr:hypothetical protein [Chitinibacter fontanus]QLI80630.1 hypothetical protein HZU75_03280 [Chitinibacter fontanus]
MKIALGMAILLLAATASAEQYYQPDPAKLAKLEAERCAKLQKEDSLISRRLSGGNNKSYDIEKMKARQQVVQADFNKYCTKK